MHRKLPELILDVKSSIRIVTLRIYHEVHPSQSITYILSKCIKLYGRRIIFLFRVMPKKITFDFLLVINAHTHTLTFWCKKLRRTTNSKFQGGQRKKKEQKTFSFCRWFSTSSIIEFFSSLFQLFILWWPNGQRQKPDKLNTRYRKEIKRNLKKSAMGFCFCNIFAFKIQ